jgi:hypothetical protein
MIVRLPSGARHDIGAEVEVRNRFEGGWSRGFVVVEIVADGYVLRRQSDGAVLGCVFGSSTVRASEPRR